MKPARLEEIERLFHSALECDPAELHAYLDAACHGDETVRRRVEALLKSDQHATDFIETPPCLLAAGAIETEQPHSLVGHSIGHYKILGRLGAGGMGVVYLAERVDDQYRKQVAIKLIRRGMDS